MRPVRLPPWAAGATRPEIAGSPKPGTGLPQSSPRERRGVFPRHGAVGHNRRRACHNRRVDLRWDLNLPGAIDHCGHCSGAFQPRAERLAHLLRRGQEGNVEPVCLLACCDLVQGIDRPFGLAASPAPARSWQNSPITQGLAIHDGVPADREIAYPCRCAGQRPPNLIARQRRLPLNDGINCGWLANRAITSLARNCVMVWPSGSVRRQAACLALPLASGKP
jgi:hypothetical protein